MYQLPPQTMATLPWVKRSIENSGGVVAVAAEQAS